jgi:hypothetical protein
LLSVEMQRIVGKTTSVCAACRGCVDVLCLYCRRNIFYLLPFSALPDRIVDGTCSDVQNSAGTTKLVMLAVVGSGSRDRRMGGKR